MILLDADVLLIELRYPHDARSLTNRQALGWVLSNSLDRGMTLQALLEVVGHLSFGTPAGKVSGLPLHLASQFGLVVFPDPNHHPDYAGCRIAEILTQMSSKMALGDAVQALQIAHFAPSADCLLTWNAKHFVGKVVVPVLTPEEWLRQQGVIP